MFIYNGKNPDTGDRFTKEFDDEDDAKKFAQKNLSFFPQYAITSTEDDNEVIDASYNHEENEFGLDDFYENS